MAFNVSSCKSEKTDIFQAARHCSVFWYRTKNEACIERVTFFEFEKDALPTFEGKSARKSKLQRYFSGLTSWRPGVNNRKL